MSQPSDTLHTSIHSRVVDKLHHSRFTAMSGKMAAIVGFILNVRYTNPTMTSVIVTSDLNVLAEAEGEVGANHYVGHYDDLVNNWLRLLRAANLSNGERAYADACFAERIGLYGDVDA